MSSPMPTAAEQSAAIVAELREAGFDVDSVYALCTLGTDYKDAVPILTRWLPRVRDFGLKETILRNLAVRFAKSALPAIIEDYPAMDERIDPTGWQLRWAAGNAVEVIWDDAYYDQLRDLATTQEYGRGREMIVRGMGKSKNPDAVTTLIGLLEDDDVRVSAVISLRKLKAVAAREPLERIRGHQEAWVQKEIDKTLAKLAG